MGELIGEGIGKTFAGGVRALADVSFRVRAGGVLALLGPSGCGKSTLLRIVAGLEAADAGRLTLDGARFDALPPGRRDVGFVFQSYALYPHLTVEENLTLALRVRRLPNAEIAARLREVCELLGIGELLERRPRQLSGGQQQRVALGRALVRRPRLYLMDEPLSNLDALLREEMRSELKALFRRLGATVLYVTHDQSEATALADEVLVLRAGKPAQLAPPQDVYARPADLFTATFVGSPRMTLWRGRRAAGSFEARGVRVPLPEALAGGPELYLGLRPEDVALSSEPHAEAWPAEVELVEPLGDRALITLRVGGERLRALLAAAAAPAGRTWARVPRERRHWFDAASERRL
jgi:multiple sugar transport system ATP-binding protein